MKIKLKLPFSVDTGKAQIDERYTVMALDVTIVTDPHRKERTVIFVPSTEILGALGVEIITAQSNIGFMQYVGCVANVRSQYRVSYSFNINRYMFLCDVSPTNDDVNCYEVFFTVRYQHMLVYEGRTLVESDGDLSLQTTYAKSAMASAFKNETGFILTPTPVKRG